MSECENLEAKCSSLENELGGVKKVQLRQFEYSSMLVKNQSWKYKAQVCFSTEHWEIDEDVAEFVLKRSRTLKDLTEKLRRGEFPNYHGNNEKGINLDWGEDGPILDYDAIGAMSPHWMEFADALTQFTPTFGMLPDDCETYFTLENVQVDLMPHQFVTRLLKNALMNKPFQTLSFVNKLGVGDNVGDGGMTIDNIIDIMDSNKYLRKLTIGNNRIQLGQMEKICSVLCRGSIVELNLRNCFENGLGDDIMAYLLTNGGSNLQRLGLDSNGLNSSTVTLLANSLATNPPLKDLDLSDNGLSVDYVKSLANALRSNNSLRCLKLSGNSISDAGFEAFRRVLQNESSLNSLASSNHNCVVTGVGFACWNKYGFWEKETWHEKAEKAESFNRARKIYKLLSERNKSMSASNVQHFDDIDVKFLPFMIKSVQRYASVVHPHDHQRVDYCRVEPLSIIYEVMRKWDKVFPLYTD